VEAREELKHVHVANGNGDLSFVTSKQHKYERLIVRVRQIVAESLPTEATVLVVSKGDDELLKFEGRTAWHFPRTEDGTYAGQHPANSAAAITHLEQLRAKGAEYILFPGTAFWWLEFYEDFRAYLDRHYALTMREGTECIIFDLRSPKVQPTTLAVAATPVIAPNKLTSLRAQESNLRVELAQALSTLGRYSQAHSVLLEGLRHDSTNLRLLVELVKSEQNLGNTAAAEQYANRVLEEAPDDYDANFELARLAWQRGKLDFVEERLQRLLQLYPSDVPALAELVQLYCSRIEDSTGGVEKTLLNRLVSCLKESDKMRRLSPHIHLQVAEALGRAGEIEPAVASLEAAIAELDFTSEQLQGFTWRQLRPFLINKSTIPFADESSLAKFLTHAGNGFAAVHDHFRAEACYRLALATNDGERTSANEAARFNLAFAAMARGDVLGTLQHLSTAAARSYPEQTAGIMWPAQQGVAWPYASFDLSAAFEKLKPEGVNWPKITVITPSFNQAEYVEETLLSVLNQNYPALEYIVLDAESADGTIEILRRYQPRISKLIIEPDEGQTDALNKGLHMSTGEIILWVNSDDLLGPGSLFVVALAYLTDQADLIAGFCFEHTKHRFGVVNLPAVTPATFNVECLGDLFTYWLKGHYFYQPEVAFSRRIFEKAGASLAKDLHYTMDYEFWLRCAQAGARLSVIHWPIGFFRKHEKQKTTLLAETIIEQARVRDRFVLPRPGFELKLEIQRRFSKAFSKRAPEICVVSTRASKIFSQDTARELRGKLATSGLEVDFASDFEELKPRVADLVILLIHLHKDEDVPRKLRESGYQGPIVGWFWDNHHHVFENQRAATDLDICIPGHEFASSYLRSQRYLTLPSVPLCVTQWTEDEARECFEKYGFRSRSDALYGGFVRYAFAEKRNRLIEELISEHVGGVYFLEEHQLESYFGLPARERFRRWASHKVSISLPLCGDLSQRFFDALLAGQIPIVPDDAYDLDELIPRRLQDELPVVRVHDYTVAEIMKAHATALSLFDEGGRSGVRRRHRFAIENHTFAARISSIVKTLRGLT
jgi:tetratricopeptide (TPR) repeat protein